MKVLRDAVWLAAHTLRHEAWLVADRHQNLEHVAFDELGDRAARYLAAAVNSATGWLDEEAIELLLSFNSFSHR